MWVLSWFADLFRVGLDRAVLQRFSLPVCLDPPIERRDGSVQSEREQTG